MNRPALLLALICLQLFPDELSAQFSSGRGEIRIMWYNVENLFHPTVDTLHGDDEFTPEGVRHWTYSRYRKKITNAAKVIIAAGLWDPPDVVGLGEIEEASLRRAIVVEHGLDVDPATLAKAEGAAAVAAVTGDEWP